MNWFQKRQLENLQKQKAYLARKSEEEGKLYGARFGVLKEKRRKEQLEGALRKQRDELRGYTDEQLKAKRAEQIKAFGRGTKKVWKELRSGYKFFFGKPSRRYHKHYYKKRY